MYLNLGSAVLCDNSVAEKMEDVCQTIYDITAPCCPGCGSTDYQRLSRWIPVDRIYRRGEWARAHPVTLLANKKLIQLTTVVEEGSTDGKESVARATP